jgi:GntR family transcriptional regulator, carbon starvation induced regulator
MTQTTIQAPTPTPTQALVGAASTAPQNIALQDAASFHIYRLLLADIVNCHLAPGARLRFEILRDQYKVGVGTLREALSHLVSEGLVRTEAGRGFSVAPVSLTDMLDVAEWRVEFEVRAVTQSIRTGDDAWEAEIVTAHHLLAKTEVPTLDATAEVRDLWKSRHRRFHDAIGAACGSPWLLHFRSILFEQAQRYQRLVALHGPRLPRKADDHREIMEAALARDEPRAVRAVEQHIRRTVGVALKHVPGFDVLKSGAGLAQRALVRPLTRPVRPVVKKPAARPASR